MNTTTLVIILIVAAIFTSAVAIIIAIVTANRKKKEHIAVIHEIQELEPHIEPALDEISSLYNYSHYITESERLYIEDKYSSLKRLLNKIVKAKELESSAQKESILRLHKALSNTETFKKENNKHFTENQMRIHKEFFDNILAYPLDQQQRESIVSLEDNVLVISSADSGKTMTTVGKVHYLVDKQGIDPSKILLITFTHKAAESLSQRLGIAKLKCVTFHKLALDLIAEAMGQKPTLTGSDFSLQVYQDLLNNDKAFHQAIADYILRSRYKMKDQFEYELMTEYLRDRKNFGVQAYYTDMDGHSVFCKSDEESQIADWLGGRGIKFRYEEKYEFSTVDKEHRQYTPDFSIYFTADDGTHHRLYLEHFAVNEYGHCPKWFGLVEEYNYLQGIEWKRFLHKNKRTTLLETSSADFHKGNVFEKLEQQLKECGVKINLNTRNEISHELVKQEKNILDMLTSFNFLMKSKSMTLEEVQKEAAYNPDRVTVNQIIAPFVAHYKAFEAKRGEIDFTDAIIQATKICNNGHKPEYDYILVDEFQDISMDRYKFLQALRRDAPLTKLFCVGDDWQSIYRFAGSDMALFKNFSKFFGYTKECRMETTYRFGEPLIEKSSKFILTNPEQKKKNVHSFSKEATTAIDFIPTKDRRDVSDKVKAIVDAIPVDKEVYLLGRYSFDVKVLNSAIFKVQDKNGKISLTYNGREMSFMTIHQSKGLESDYVILLNCNSGTLGFPADIADSPVLRYVLSEPDGYKFGEERRIFYVGITRAKTQTYVLYDEKHPSPFVKEFVEGVTEALNKESIPEDELCPKCKCGRVRQVYKGVAVNGNPYFVYRCSNQKLGCDYRETKFVNINKKRTHN